MAIAIAGQDMTDALLWLRASGSIRKVGEPTQEFERKDIGIRLTSPEQMSPAHLQVLLQYVWSSGYWGRHGTPGGGVYRICADDVNVFLSCLNDGDVTLTSPAAVLKAQEEGGPCEIPPAPDIETPEERATRPFMGFMMGAAAASLAVLLSVKITKRKR